MSETRKVLHPEISVSLGIVVFVAALFAVAIGKKTGMIDNPTAVHAANVILGLMLSLFGNYFPKFARPLDEQLDVAARQLAADRWSGRVMVFAGFVYAALWLIAPLTDDQLKVVAPVFVLVVLALVFANQMFISRTGVLPFRKGRSLTRAEVSRNGAYLILHALAWAYAMMLADVIWGDQSTIWMIIAFTVVNGILMALVLGQNIRSAQK